jgi:uncharacterized membrane protein
MERRLLKAIINPAMIATWLAGLYVAWSGALIRRTGQPKDSICIYCQS